MSDACVVFHQGTMSCAFFYGSLGTNVVLDCQLTNSSLSIALHNLCQPPLSSFINDLFSNTGLPLARCPMSGGPAGERDKSSRVAVLDTLKLVRVHLLPYPAQRHKYFVLHIHPLMAHIHNPCLSCLKAYKSFFNLSPPHYLH